MNASEMTVFDFGDGIGPMSRQKQHEEREEGLRPCSMKRLTVGSLFSGFGGLDLGLERAGFQVAWQVESNPYAVRVLTKHWPSVRRLNDVRLVSASTVSRVDVLAGGFPCQDLSTASHGRGRGLEGPQSSLWWEFDRIIEEVHPAWVIIENVGGGAFKKWVPIVRGALHARLYASVCLQLRASDFGAPFRGTRAFVIAQTYGYRKSARRVDEEMAVLREPSDPRRQGWGSPPPRALGVADGVPGRVERLRGIGNAVMPQMAEFVGHRILNAVARASGDAEVFESTLHKLADSGDAK